MIILAIIGGLVLTSILVWVTFGLWENFTYWSNSATGFKAKMDGYSQFSVDNDRKEFFITLAWWIAVAFVWWLTIGIHIRIGWK